MRNEGQQRRWGPEVPLRRPPSRTGSLPWVVLTALLGVLVYLRVATPKGPEARVSAAVEQLRSRLLAASRVGADSEQARRLAQIVLPEAQLRVGARLIQERGSDGLLLWLSTLQVNAASLEVKSQELALSADGTSARAFLDVLAIGKNAGATRIEERRVHLRFENRGGGWKLADLEVLPEVRDYPEARP